jgi:hypothetical protein
MQTLTIGSLFQECDFCRKKGTVGKTLLNKDGWYFCAACLREIEYERKRRWEKNVTQGKTQDQGNRPL